jgi:hypothetical protein
MFQIQQEKIRGEQEAGRELAPFLWNAPFKRIAKKGQNPEFRSGT